MVHIQVFILLTKIIPWTWVTHTVIEYQMERTYATHTCDWEHVTRPVSGSILYSYSAWWHGNTSGGRLHDQIYTYLSTILVIGNVVLYQWVGSKYTHTCGWGYGLMSGCRVRRYTYPYLRLDIWGQPFVYLYIYIKYTKLVRYHTKGNIHDIWLCDLNEHVSG